jgi:hypothetical protein
MTRKIDTSASAKSSNGGENEKRVLFNGGPMWQKWYMHVWMSLPENDIEAFAIDYECPIGEHDENHPYLSPCTLRTVVVNIPDGKMKEFNQPFENHIVAGRYCEFLLGLIVNGPVSKNVQTWQLGKQTMVIIENEMVILLEVLSNPVSVKFEPENQEQVDS